MPTLTPFAHGYALLVGVDRCQYDAWSLPVTIQDVQTLRHLLVDPALCAYPHDEQYLYLLHDAGVTGAPIVHGLAWLQAQTAVGAITIPNKTETATSPLPGRCFSLPGRFAFIFAHYFDNVTFTVGAASSCATSSDDDLAQLETAPQIASAVNLM